jgi:hypothetical protein
VVEKPSRRDHYPEEFDRIVKEANDVKAAFIELVMLIKQRRT